MSDPNKVASDAGWASIVPVNSQVLLPSRSVPSSSINMEDIQLFDGEDEKQEYETCIICGEAMTDCISPADLIKNRESGGDRGKITCLSGHSFCASCWTTSTKMQVIENGATTLQCIGFKCGECLDSSVWGDALLGEHANKLNGNR